jgi:hypothetical protein
MEKKFKLQECQDSTNKLIDILIKEGTLEECLEYIQSVKDKYTFSVQYIREYAETLPVNQGVSIGRKVTPEGVPSPHLSLSRVS